MAISGRPAVKSATQFSALKTETQKWENNRVNLIQTWWPELVTNWAEIALQQTKQNRQILHYLPELQSQWRHHFPMNLWGQKPDGGSAAQPEPAAAPLSKTTSADPARALPCCSHQGETQHEEKRKGGETAERSPPAANTTAHESAHKGVFYLLTWTRQHWTDSSLWF